MAETRFGPRQPDIRVYVLIHKSAASLKQKMSRGHWGSDRNDLHEPIPASLSKSKLLLYLRLGTTAMDTKDHAWFIHLFNKFLLSTYCVPGTVLSSVYN